MRPGRAPGKASPHAADPCDLPTLSPAGGLLRPPRRDAAERALRQPGSATRRPELPGQRPTARDAIRAQPGEGQGGSAPLRREKAAPREAARVKSPEEAPRMRPGPAPGKAAREKRRPPTRGGPSSARQVTRPG